MGFSHLHSSEVPLVLNLQTGSITAQFHVVFDDYFSTVSSVEREIDPPNHWAELCLEHTTYIPTEPMPDESTHFLDDDWLTLDEREIKSRTIARSDAIRTTFVPDVQLPDVSSEPPSPAALLKSPVVLIPVNASFALHCNSTFSSGDYFHSTNRSIICQYTKHRCSFIHLSISLLNLLLLFRFHL
jgi:hypothetical protein